MRIGELAKATGLPVETIRFYEQQGLITAAQRSSNNYRLYNDNQLETLLFIGRCRALDMTLAEIKTIIDAKNKDNNCAEINHLIAEHLKHVKKRIKELKQLEKELNSLMSSCLTVQNTNDCGILKELEHLSTAEIRQHKHDSHIVGAHNALKNK